MRVIISPAKKMREDDTIPPLGKPCFLSETQQILDDLRSLSSAERKKLWMCNDAIAAENEERLQKMNINSRLIPAILSYDGIQYQYMAPSAFDHAMMSWLQGHLRILSAFYGVLRPMDGVTPYRLEMQAKAHIAGTRNLYDFWGDRLYTAVIPEDRTILNLASEEYSKAIEKYIRPGDCFITCVFGEMEKGRIVQKGVYAKIARGEMVRYLAEISASSPEQAKGFTRLDYAFHPEQSTEETYVFLREPKAMNRHPDFEF